MGFPEPVPGPLKPGSVFTVLNLHYGLSASSAMAELAWQAKRAVELGFDGVGLSEHHAGFPGYLPAPMLAGAALLAEMPTGFFAALPVLVPLRSAANVVEEAAWLDARYPGRVVLGMAAGYAESDFGGYEVSFEERFPRFRTIFREVSGALSGGGSESLRADPAVVEAAGRVGLMMMTRGPQHARLAARSGAGITPTQLPVEGYRELFGAYRAAGGPGPCVVQKWVFVGEEPNEAVEALNATVERAPGDHSWWDSSVRIVPMYDPDPRALAGRLVEWFRATTADALCVRFHLGPMGPEATREQIERFGSEVLPLVRRELGR